MTNVAVARCVRVQDFIHSFHVLMSTSSSESALETWIDDRDPMWLMLPGRGANQVSGLLCLSLCGDFNVQAAYSSGMRLLEAPTFNRLRHLTAFTDQMQQHLTRSMVCRRRTSCQLPNASKYRCERRCSLWRAVRGYPRLLCRIGRSHVQL